MAHRRGPLSGNSAQVGAEKPPTPRQAFAAMVQRVEGAAVGSGVAYTPELRQLEDDWETAARAVDAGHTERDTAALALDRLEDAWLVEISRARRRKARTA